MSVIGALALAQVPSAFAAGAQRQSTTPRPLMTGALSGVDSLVSDGSSSCAVGSGGRVDCWGYGYDGELGNGKFYFNGHTGSAIPVRVKGVGGVDTLTGVGSLASDGDGYCALLTGGGVDCWGLGNSGQLGNGSFYSHSYSHSLDGSAVPVQVLGVGGTDTLTGVTTLTSDGDGYCAVLSSGGLLGIRRLRPAR